MSKTKRDINQQNFKIVDSNAVNQNKFHHRPLDMNYQLTAGMRG